MFIVSLLLFLTTNLPLKLVQGKVYTGINVRTGLGSYKNIAVLTASNYLNTLVTALVALKDKLNTRFFLVLNQYLYCKK